MIWGKICQMIEKIEFLLLKQDCLHLSEKYI